MDPDFKALVLSARNKRVANEIADLILSGRQPLGDLMDCFFSDDRLLCQRASWSVSVLANTRPDLLEPFIPEMIAHVQLPVHDAVVRNTVRAWVEMEIAPEYRGTVYDLCFNYMSDPKFPVAVRVFAMTVCTNMATHHPELAEEIIPVIEDHYDHSSAGFRSRARKELKRLHKLL